MENENDANNTNMKIDYPSAEMLHNVCYEDYRRVLETYDKIYDKVNVALAFSGAILLVILSNFDYTIIGRFAEKHSNLELLSLILLLLSSSAGVVLILWAVIQLLLLMQSKELNVFDSIAIRNDKIYKEEKDVAGVWLIDKYTQAVSTLRPQNEKKQKSFDAAVLKIIIALICYAFALVMQKGL